MLFVHETHGGLASQLIDIDGKALRHSFDTSKQSKDFHLLSAWACEQGVSLCQLTVDTKTNEITALPELLDSLD